MLDTHTWDQLSLMARGIVRYDMDRMNLVLGPIATALGVKYKPGDVGSSRAPKKGKTQIDHTDPGAVARAEARDAKMLMAFQAQGLRISEE